MSVWRFSLLCLFTVLWLEPAQADNGDTGSELAALIRRAQHSPLSKIAQEKTRAAQAVEDEMAGKRWTTLEAKGFLAPSPRIRCDSADCTQTSPKDVNINIAGLFAGLNVSLTQPLYTGGKLQYARQAAKYATAARSALEGEKAGDIAVQTARAYYAFLLAQELIWMLEEGAEHIESGRKTLEKKLAEGAADSTVQDRFRVQSLQSEVGARIADAYYAQRVALASLRALIGDDEATLQGGELEALVYELPAPNAAFVDKRVDAAKQGARAYQALEDLEKAGYWPDLAIVGGFNVARAQGVDEPPGAFANDPYNTTSGYVALAASWKLTPLSLRARIRQKEAQKREAQATVEVAERVSKLDRIKALAEANQAQERLKALRAGARAGKAWVASVLQADAIGAASAKELADAYIAHFSSRAKVLESIYQWNLAVFELRRQSGEFSTLQASYNKHR